MTLDEFAKHVATRTNDFLANYIKNLDDAVPVLKESLGYALLLGGKRARPLLCYATGSALGQDLSALDYSAAALECIHAYSLVHDDMPEMDNDTLRRGHETVHIKFGQAMALLTGDTLQALAYEMVSNTKSGLSTNCMVKLCSILAKSSGYRGMCGGQALDLLAQGQHITLDQLRVLHAKKTGALIEAAVMMGAYSVEDVDDATLSALNTYARLIGLSFQVWDDVLDLIGDTAIMGKTQGSDLAAHKSTYPALMGLSKAQDFAKQCADEAIAVLKPLAIKTQILEDFANFTVTRDH